MNLPKRVPKGSPLHWAGRIAVYLLVTLFVLRAVTQWNNSGLGLLADAFIVAIAVSGVNLINTTNLEYFPPHHKAEIFRLKGMFLQKLGDGEAAHQVGCNWGLGISFSLFFSTLAFNGARAPCPCEAMPLQRVAKAAQIPCWREVLAFYGPF